MQLTTRMRTKMKQRSQNLTKQIQAQEQVLHTLQTATETSQKEWDDRKKQIAKDTKVTIETSKQAIAKATDESKAKLANLDKHIKEGDEIYLKQRSKQEKYFSKVDQELEDLNYSKKVLIQTNTDLSLQNTELASTIKVSMEALEHLKVEETEIKENISDFRTTEDELKKSTEELEQKLDEVSKQLTDLTEDFSAKDQQLNRDISVLELKRQNITNEILESRAKDDKVRENLAKWAKTLDDKDKNLRIREARVNQQEIAIARNYNLLDM